MHKHKGAHSTASGAAAAPTPRKACSGTADRAGCGLKAALAAGELEADHAGLIKIMQSYQAGLSPGSKWVFICLRAATVMNKVLMAAWMFKIRVDTKC